MKNLPICKFYIWQFLKFSFRGADLFNSKNGKIHYLNKKATEIFSPSIPLSIYELPPLIILPICQLSTASPEIIITSILTQPPSLTTSYLTTLSSISYKIVIHKISDQNFLFLMEKRTNTANTNNFKNDFLCSAWVSNSFKLH